MVDRETKRVGFIIVSTDRGLCGGLNINLFKKAIESQKGWKSKGIEVDLCLIGSKAISFFRSFGAEKTSAALANIGDYPKIADLIGGVKVMLDNYENGQIDRLYIGA